MKFDVICGNPPYQNNNGSGLNGASAIYDQFMCFGAEKSQYQLFIVPMRWATNYSSKGINKQWVYNELHSNKYRYIHYFSDSETVFKGTRIRGGIMYYLRDNKYNGECIVEHEESGSRQFRQLAPYNWVDMLIANKIDLDILSKVWSVDSFSSCVSNTNPFGIETSQDVKAGSLKLYRSFGKIETADISQIDKGNEYINTYGNIILRTFGYGENNDKFEVMSKPIIKMPGEICTGSYLLVYPTESLEEASMVNKFMQTHFINYLVGLRKSTHNCSKDAYKFVPMQRFNSNSDIDFSLDISKIDEQLYRKYNLSQVEIEYIERKFS